MHESNVSTLLNIVLNVTVVYGQAGVRHFLQQCATWERFLPCNVDRCRECIMDQWSI